MFFFFFLSLCLRGKTHWLPWSAVRSLAYNSSSDQTWYKKQCYSRVGPSIYSWLTTLFNIVLFYISVSSVWLVPLGKTPHGLYFWRRKQVWGWLNLFKSWQNSTRIKWVHAVSPVSLHLSPSLPLSLSVCLSLNVFVALSLLDSSVRTECSHLGLQLSWSLLQLRDIVSGLAPARPRLYCALPAHCVTCQTCHSNLCCRPNLRPVSPLMRLFSLYMGRRGWGGGGVGRIWILNQCHTQTIIMKRSSVLIKLGKTSLCISDPSLNF